MTAPVGAEAAAGARMGRLPTLTTKLVEEIGTLVRYGNRPLAAAKARGVSRRSFYAWMARGRAAQALLEEGRDPPESEDIYHFPHTRSRRQRPSRRSWRSRTCASSGPQRERGHRMARAPLPQGMEPHREARGQRAGGRAIETTGDSARERLEKRLNLIGQRILEEEAEADEKGEGPLPRVAANPDL